MRRLLLLGTCGFLLACAGLGESILEGVTGEEIDIREDGMEMTLPGDGEVSLSWGPSAQHDPALVPMSAPRGGTLGVSGQVRFPHGPPTHFVLYGEVPGDMAEIAAGYRQELEGMGLTVSEEAPEPATINLEARQGELSYIVSVSMETPTASSMSVMLGVGSKEAIEQGMAAAPN